MEPIIVWYLRMSIFYFIAGALIGVAMLIWPDEAGYYISVHAHLNLLGFMSMMIYGVGYHILPKFSGRNIYSPLIMNLQFWFANAGLIGIAVSWPLVIRDLDLSLTNNILIISAFLSLASVILFAFNMLKTIKAVKM
jgi:cbb3-type cytochrome oxidase subunit 1